MDSFCERCYGLLRRVPSGRVTTYGEIARALGSRGFRAVGMAMNKNPYAPEVPCHRVVCSDGKIGGFAGGTKRKVEMLREEGVEIVDGRIVGFAERFWGF
jgi:methylated-DNA-[protein]-cysteine S-methyltransferase